MGGFIERTRGLLRKQEGLSTVEYVVLLVLIVALSVATWNKFGVQVHKKLDKAKGLFVDNVNPKSK